MSLYRNILRQALSISWRYKYLWFFGLFAALVSNGSAYNMLVNGFTGNQGGVVGASVEKTLNWGFFNTETISGFAQRIIEYPADMIVLIFVWLLIAVLFCFIVWLINVCQAALVNNSALIINSKKHNFRNGLDAGIKKFWPVFGLNFILKFLVYGALWLISFPLIILAGYLNQFTVNIVQFILFMVFIAVAFVISFIIKYSISYVVLKGSKLLESIKLGVKLFLKNWLITLEMGFILFFVNFVVGFLFFLGFIVVLVVPFLFIALVLQKLLAMTAFWLIVLLAFILFFISLVIIGSILATFNISAWTNLYLELVGKGGVSKLVRIFNKK